MASCGLPLLHRVFYGLFTAFVAADIVMIGSNRLEAEMKYWLCSADGEVADVLLHVMAETTINGWWSEHFNGEPITPLRRL